MSHAKKTEMKYSKQEKNNNKKRPKSVGVSFKLSMLYKKVCLICLEQEERWKILA